MGSFAVRSLQISKEVFRVPLNALDPMTLSKVARVDPLSQGGGVPGEWVCINATGKLRDLLFSGKEMVVIWRANDVRHGAAAVRPEWL